MKKELWSLEEKELEQTLAAACSDDRHVPPLPAPVPEQRPIDHGTALYAGGPASHRGPWRCAANGLGQEKSGT